MQLTKISLRRISDRSRLITRGPLLAALALIGLLPWLFQYLPLLDYPNWLAEAEILKRLFQQDQATRALWEIRLVPTPNILVPMIMAGLSNFTSVEVAGKVVISAYLLGFPLGMLLLRPVHTSRSAMFFGVLWVFNVFFYGGFISYLVSLTLLWLALAVLQRWHEKPKRPLMLLFGFLSLLCYFAHLMGYVALLVVVICYLLENRLREPGRRSKWLLVAVQLPALLFLIWYAYSRIQSDPGIPLSYYQSVANKAFALVEPFFVAVHMDPIQKYDFTSVINGLLLLFVAYAMLRYRQGFVFNHQSAAGIVLVVIAVLIPFPWFAGMLRSDERLLFPGFLLLFGGIQMKAHEKTLTVILSLVMVALFALVALQFQAVQGEFAIIERESARLLHADKEVVVVAVMRPPIFSECVPTAGNAGAIGTFPMLRAPFYAALNNTGEPFLPLFESGLLRAVIQEQRPSGTNVVKMIELDSSDRLARNDRLSHLEVGPRTAVLALGCPKDIEKVVEQVHPTVETRAGLGEAAFLAIFESDTSVPFIRRAAYDS